MLWVQYDVGETLGAALLLQPAASRVVLVAGTADLDRANLAYARQEVARYARRVTIEEMTGLSLDETVRHVAALPPETVVVFLTMNRDGAGTPLQVGEALRRVVAASGAPVYTTIETSVGGGVIGGAVTSYTTLGHEAARAVRRRLDDPARRHQLPRLDGGPEGGGRLADSCSAGGCGRTGCRQGARLRFKPPSLWEQYRWYMTGAVLLLVAQSCSWPSCLVERRHRRRAQSALTERQEELERSDAALRGRTREVEASDAQVRALAGKLITAQEQERAQIARELHDEVGQSLTIVKLSIDTMRSTDDPTSLQEMIDESSALVGRALDQVRDLSLLLRPSLLDHLGLEAALRWLVNTQSNRVGYRATLTTDRLNPPPTAGRRDHLLSHRARGVDELAASILLNSSFFMFLVWAVGALTVQIVTYAAVSRVLPQMNTAIADNNAAMGGLMGITSLAVGIINAVCLS